MQKFNTQRIIDFEIPTKLERFDPNFCSWVPGPGMNLLVKGNKKMYLNQVTHLRLKLFRFD